MSENLSASAKKVQDALKALGYSFSVLELPDSTRTAPEAAQAVGVSVGQIVKSLVFRTRSTGKPIMVIASGANRVNEKKIKNLLGEAIEKADADFVRQHTGFAIGGIPPVGLAESMTVLIDQDLLQYAEVWAAAGTPHAVFSLNPASLQQMTGGQVVEIT